MQENKHTACYIRHEMIRVIPTTKWFTQK